MMEELKFMAVPIVLAFIIWIVLDTASEAITGVWSVFKGVGHI